MIKERSHKDSRRHILLRSSLKKRSAAQGGKATCPTLHSQREVMQLILKPGFLPPLAQYAEDPKCEVRLIAGPSELGPVVLTLPNRRPPRQGLEQCTFYREEN